MTGGGGKCASLIRRTISLVMDCVESNGILNKRDCVVLLHHLLFQFWLGVSVSSVGRGLS